MSKITLTYLAQRIEALALAGPVPSSRTLTINGVTYDLSANRTWTVTASVSDGDKGDVTVSSSGAVWTIDNDTITNAKAANVPTATFKGRTTAGTGDPEDLTVSQAKTLLDLTGTNSGDETATTLGATINAAGAATPNNTDFIATAESGGLLKKITWTNVKAFLKTYFDTLYQAAGTYLTASNISDTVYGAGWNADTTNAPSKNTVYDKIEAVIAGNVATATALQTARKINGVAFDGSADIQTEAWNNIILGLGGDGKSIHWAGNCINNNGVAPTSQQCIWNAVWLPKAATITGVNWLQQTQGDYTASNYNGVGLYSYSGGTLTLERSSTNDGDIWKAATGAFGSKAFSSTYAASAGLYFIALIYSRSAVVTAPVIGFASNIAPFASIITQDFTDSAKLSGTLSSQTSLPATQAMSGITASSSNRFWLQLY